MRQTLRAAGCLVAAMMAAGTAWAQTPSAALTLPIEVGVDAFGVASLGPLQRVRASFPADDRISFEMFTTLPYREERSTTSSGFYGIQARQRIRAASTPRMDTFVTYGATGPWQYSSRRGFEFVPLPIFPAGGAGFEHQVAKHLAVRAEAQVMILMMSRGECISPVVGGTIGVSVPFGRR